MSFDEKCRFCLRAEKKMCPIFNTNFTNFYRFDSVRTAVLELLRNSGKIKIFDGDGFPDMMCKDCLDQFFQIYSFVLKSKRSDAILKQLKEPVIYLNRLKLIPLEETYDNSNCFASESLPLDSCAKIECIEIEDDYESYLSDNNENEVTDAGAHVSQETIYESYENLESAFESDDLIEVDDGVDNELFECPDCPIVCMTLKLLQQHLMEGHLVNKLCKICDEEFEFSALQHCCKHLPIDYGTTEAFTVTPNGKFLCLICEKTFSTKKNYTEHATLFEQLSFECGICAIAFRTIGERNDHMKQSHRVFVNRKKWKLDCSVCFEIFSSQSELLKHMKEGHIDDSQGCAICFQSFPNAIELANHMAASHTDKMPYTCVKCRLDFVSRSGYVLHFHKTHGDEPFKCDICSITFRSEGSLVAHKLSHLKEKKLWKCDICSHSYEQSTELFKHIYFCHSESNRNDYKCETCSKLFRFKRSLLAHEKCHKAVQFKFQCAICLQRFEEKTDLNDHARTFHPNNRSHRCEMCPEVFVDRQSLRSHIRAEHVLLSFEGENSGNGPGPAILRSELNLTEYRENHLGKVHYKCDSCEKTHSNKYALLEHIRVNHSGPKPTRHNCDQCSKSFSQYNSLRDHIRNFHTGETIKCEICSKACGSEMRKAIHMRTHTGERTTQCKICMIMLRYESDLKPHMIVMHPELAGSLGYKCEICSKICSTKSKLARHERKHKSERPFQCDICNKRFKLSDTVRTHKRSVHSINVPKGSRLPVPETVEDPTETVDASTVKRGRTKMPGSSEPIDCEICKKTMQNKKILRSHMIVIHPESASFAGYKCEICSKTCVSRYKLTVHERRHNSEKLYECDICGAGFKYRPNVRAHKRKMHGIVEGEISQSQLAETVAIPPKNGSEMTESLPQGGELAPMEPVEVPVSEQQIEYDLTDLLQVPV